MASDEEKAGKWGSCCGPGRSWRWFLRRWASRTAGTILRPSTILSSGVNPTASSSRNRKSRILTQLVQDPTKRSCLTILVTDPTKGKPSQGSYQMILNYLGSLWNWSLERILQAILRMDPYKKKILQDRALSHSKLQRILPSSRRY